MQHTQQPGGLLLVLFPAGLLRPGKEQGGRNARAVKQHRGVHLLFVAAVRAGQVMQRPRLGAAEQVGAFAGVYDEPDVGGKGLPAVWAGEGGGLAEAVSHAVVSAGASLAPAWLAGNCWWVL